MGSAGYSPQRRRQHEAGYCIAGKAAQILAKVRELEAALAAKDDELAAAQAAVAAAGGPPGNQGQNDPLILRLA